MNLKRLAWIALLALVSVTTYVAGRGRNQAAPGVRPATITYSLVSYPSLTGTPRFAFTEILGVRSDGSTSKARLVPISGTAPSQYNLNITDIQTSRHIFVDHITKSKTTYSAKGIVDSYVVKPASSCSGDSSDRILGYATLLEDHTNTVPGRTMRVRTWRAPELNCLILRQESERSDPASNGGKTVLSATQVVLGEPEGWMFEVPSEYVERSPAEVLGEAARLNGLPQPRTPDTVEQVYRGSPPPKKP